MAFDVGQTPTTVFAGQELKQTCARAGLRCAGHYPHSEMHFTPEASIALFRIAQEALEISITHSSVTTAELCWEAHDTGSNNTGVDSFCSRVLRRMMRSGFTIRYTWNERVAGM